MQAKSLLSELLDLIVVMMAHTYQRGKKFAKWIMN